MEKELLTDQDGFVQQLRELRKQLNAPGYIPIRTTHAKPMTKRGNAVMRVPVPQAILTFPTSASKTPTPSPAR